VGYADKIINIFETAKFIIPTLFEYKIQSTQKDGRVSFGIIPSDMLFFSRPFMKELDMSKEFQTKVYNNLFPEQTDKNLSHPALYIDLNDTKKIILISISNNYMAYVKQSKILPIHSTIKQFTSNGILLDDQSFHEIDAIIYCNRKDKSIDDFLQIVQVRFDSKSSRFTENHVYKSTFHPNIENIAFVGLSAGHLFTSKFIYFYLFPFK
jgi:hypothetical protein